MHLASTWVDYTNEWSASLGGSPVMSNHWSLMLWLSVIALLIEALIYLLAFSPLRAKRKTGWELLFYGALVNVAYGLISAFTDYGGFGQLLGALISSAVGLYFLYQVRSYYVTGKIAKVHARK